MKSPLVVGRPYRPHLYPRKKGRILTGTVPIDRPKPIQKTNDNKEIT